MRYAAPISVIALGLVVLVGWVTAVPALQTIIPGVVSMKITTAGAFLTFGWAALRLRQGVFGSVAAAAGGILVVVMILSYVGLDLDLTDSDTGRHSVRPGVPSLGTIPGFILAALALYRPAIRLLCGRLLVAVGGVAYVGYLVAVPAMYYQFEWSTAMAVHSAAGFVLLGLALLPVPFVGVTHRSWMVGFAVALHFLWGLLLLMDGSAGKVTAIYTAGLWLPGGTREEGLTMLAVGFLALLGCARPHPSPVVHVGLLLPQQAVMVLSATGAVLAIRDASFADGVVRPRAFIAADQSATILTCVFHTFALLGIIAPDLLPWIREGSQWGRQTTQQSLSR